METTDTLSLYFERYSTDVLLRMVNCQRYCYNLFEAKRDALYEEVNSRLFDELFNAYYD